MATNSIASASLILTANNQQLTQGLNQASQQITAFSTQLGKGLSFVGTGFAGFIEGQVAKLVTNFISHFKELATAVKEADKEAKALGVSLGFLQTIKAFGTVDVGAVEKAISKLEKKVASALEGDQGALDDMERLGITMRDMTSMPVEDVFKKIAQHTKDTADPARRMADAMLVFERGAKEIMPLLQKGAEGIAALEAKSRGMGLITTSEQTANVKEMLSLYKDFKMTIEGMETQSMASIAGWVVKINDTLIPVRDKLHDVLGIREKMEAWRRGDISFNPLSGWQDMRGATAAAKAAAAQELAKLSAIKLTQDIKAMEREVFKAGETFGFTAEQVKVFDLMMKGAKEGQLIGLFQQMANMQMKGFVNDLKTINEELDKQIATWGLASDAVKLWELKTKAAKNGGDMKDINRGMAEATIKLEKLAGKKLTEEADPLIETGRNIDWLNHLLNTGAINWNTYSTAINKALKQAEGALGIGGEVKLPTAMLKGSREAMELSLKEQFRGSIEPQDARARWQALIAEQKNIQAQQLEVQRKLLEEARKKNEPVIEKVM